MGGNKRPSNAGMICAAHPLAVEAGWRMLEAGGNAYDAAVAVAAALNVVEPMMSGIGGYGTILIYDAASQQLQFLNASGRIPYGANSDDFRAPTPNYRANRRGAKAVSTPGNLNAWRAMAERGALSWAATLQPAIAWAQRGFQIDVGLARAIHATFTDFSAEAKSIFGRNGQPLEEGDWLVQPQLADSLAHIAADGAAALYVGKLGKKIVKAVQKAGGFLAARDLAENEAEWIAPIHITYRDVDVYTASPPATSFPGLIRLGLMSQRPQDDWEHNSPDYLHHYAEVSKYAFFCRLKYAGSPEFEPPPLKMLLSEELLASHFAGISPTQATQFQPPFPPGESSQNTTHFVVADKQGNVVSATQTIGQLFGSRIMPAGTGIWLNNSLQYCTFEPKGNPMDAHAGRHKLSGDMPTILMKDGKPWAALGTPGGHTIAQTIPQIVINLVDFGMSMQAAIDAPRISFVEPNAVYVEPGVSNKVAEDLAARGHEVVRPNAGIGLAHGLTIDYDANGNIEGFAGGFDQRRNALVGIQNEVKASA